MTRIIFSFFNLRYVLLTWFIIYSYSVSGNEVKNETVGELLKLLKVNSDNKLKFYDFCDTANIKNFSVYSKMNNIVVVFELSDIKYKDCFKYFKISLKKKQGPVTRIMVMYDPKREVFYQFENVSCGVYDVVVNGCYTDRTCTTWEITFPRLTNVTSEACITKEPQVKSISDPNIGIEIIISTSVISIILAFAVGTLTYYYCCSVKRKTKKKEVGYKASADKHKYSKVAVHGDDRIATRKIPIYILHYYDNCNHVKERVNHMKDFLSQSPYYQVKVIESELAVILLSVNEWLRYVLKKTSYDNNWLKNVLKETDEDGSIRKIVLIDAEVKENKEENYEMENLIFTEFIDILSNDRTRCRIDYENLFVVRFTAAPLSHSERITGIVREGRYYIPNNLIDLCLNLCSGSEFDILEVESNLRELLSDHPIKHLDVMQEV